MLIGALLALSVYLPLRCGQLSLATPGFYAIGGTLAAARDQGVGAAFADMAAAEAEGEEKVGHEALDRRAIARRRTCRVASCPR